MGGVIGAGVELLATILLLVLGRDNLKACIWGDTQLLPCSFVRFCDLSYPRAKKRRKSGGLKF